MDSNTKSSGMIRPTVGGTTWMQGLPKTKPEIYSTTYATITTVNDSA